MKISIPKSALLWMYQGKFELQIPNNVLGALFVPEPGSSGYRLPRKFYTGWSTQSEPITQSSHPHMDVVV